MTWYEFALPTVVIALLIRLEAILIGPHWAWIELIPSADEDDSTAQQRWGALLRRVAIPGVVSFVLIAGWPQAYGFTDAIIVTSGAAGLLLWPILWAGAPQGVGKIHLTALYASLLVSFCASAALGFYIARFAQREGGVWAFFEENLIGIVVGTVLAGFFTGTLERLSRSASRGRSETREQ